MANSKNYNLFLFLSTLTRSLVEVFSVIILYNKGYKISDIFLFLLIMYFVGIIVNTISLIINYKFILIVSNITYGLSYLFLSFMPKTTINLIVLAIILSLSSYSYHAIRHKLALYTQNKPTNKNITLFLVLIYIATIISNILGVLFIKKLNIYLTSIIIFISSIICLFPVLTLKNSPKEKVSLKDLNIPKRKIIFNILEQSKVIFLELQPLYIYINVKSAFSYIGIFNIIINASSLIIMLFISKKIALKHFKLVTIFLGIILILKLNITNSKTLLLIAFLEGIAVKLYEKYSITKLYTPNTKNITSYLIAEEIIFFTTKTILMLVFIILSFSLTKILYILILGIVLSGFYIKDKCP